MLRDEKQKERERGDKECQRALGWRRKTRLVESELDSSETWRKHRQSLCWTSTGKNSLQTCDSAASRATDERSHHNQANNTLHDSRAKPSLLSTQHVSEPDRALNKAKHSAESKGWENSKKIGLSLSNARNKWLTVLQIPLELNISCTLCLSNQLRQALADCRASHPCVGRLLPLVQLPRMLPALLCQIWQSILR